MKRIIVIILLLSLLCPVISMAEVDYESDYETALTMAGNDLTNIQQLKEAIDLLQQLGSYKLSKSYVQYFQAVLALMQGNRDLDDIYARVEACGKAARLVQDLDARWLPSCDEILQYIKARILENKKDYRGALEAYQSLVILDAPDRTAKMLEKVPLSSSTKPANTPTPTPSLPPTPSPSPTPKRRTVYVGQILTFGHFEQDNNRQNGQESIQWQVLQVDNSKGWALVISYRSLYGAAYNTSQTSVTWATCSLRRWLNETFLYSAFSDKERQAIQEVRLDNSTYDKIFLLNKQEAASYFGSNESRRCAPTYYARANGAYHVSRYNVGGMDAGWWWLRTSGGSSATVDYVDNPGSFSTIRVNKDTGGVRPALWVSLDADIFN